MQKQIISIDKQTAKQHRIQKKIPTPQKDIGTIIIKL